jgi:CheY-like chemotaxis protein
MVSKPETVWTSSQLINSLTNKAQVFIFAYAPEKKTLQAWSGNALEILGVKDADISRDGNLFLRHVHPDDRFVLLNDLETALKDNSDYRATYRWIRPDNNELRWLHCRGKVIKDGDDALFEGVIFDLTPEFTGHIARIAGPDSLSTIIAAFPTMVFTLDKDLRIIRLNRPDSMLGFNFADPSFDSENFKIGRLFPTCFSSQNNHQYFLEDFYEIMENRKDYFRTRLESHGNDKKWHGKNGAVFNLEAFPLKEKNLIEGLLVIVSDITDNVKLERDIAKLNKTEGLRLLASGVSHNFNNSLQAIVGFASSIRSNPENPDIVISSSQAILDSVNRASDLAHQLFSFDDSSKEIMTSVDVNLAVMAAAHKIEDLFTSGVKVAVAFGNPSPAIANQDKLVQSIVEIIKNSKENCKINDTLTIRTVQVSLEDNQVQGLKRGNYAKITVSDSSHGKVLTLTQAYTTAKEFGGILLVDSSMNQGTNVAIFLPIADDEFKSKANSPSLFKIAPDIEPEVLIVDDDFMILQTSKEIIESSNYKCIVAENAKRALDLFKEFQHSLKLVLLDSLMPGVNGATLLRRMKKINPDIKAIGFSGASTEYTKQLMDAGVITVLRKPVDPDLLKSTVGSIISAKEAA